MKVAITGCTGLLGKAFVKKYSKELDIVPISRIAGDPNYIYSDFSLDSLSCILSKVDALIHLAGKRLNKVGDSDINYNLDRTVFLAAKKAGVRNIVYASSRGVYGTTLSPWSESSEIRPNNLYALGKAQSELFAVYLNDVYGLKIKCLRIAQVLSKDEYEGSMIREFLNKAFSGENIEVSVEGICREYIYIEDLMNAISVAIKSENISGIFNVGTGKGLTVLEIAQCISRSFDSKNKVLVSEDINNVYEKSIMKIDLFCKTFGWVPNFSFETAIDDIRSKGFLNG